MSVVDRAVQAGVRYGASGEHLMQSRRRYGTEQFV